ncbi:hypothetical protein ACP275_08G036500 [Erythranthe tilingii]
MEIGERLPSQSRYKQTYGADQSTQVKFFFFSSLSNYFITFQIQIVSQGKKEEKKDDDVFSSLEFGVVYANDRLSSQVDWLDEECNELVKHLWEQKWRFR